MKTIAEEIHEVLEPFYLPVYQKFAEKYLQDVEKRLEVIMDARLKYIKSRIIMDRATCAGDYSEAEEYTNLMVGS